MNKLKRQKHPPLKEYSLSDGLLKVHAQMIINSCESKKQYLKDQMRDTLSLKAFQLGRENIGSNYNPFSDIEHKYQEEMVKSFALGSTTEN